MMHHLIDEEVPELDVLSAAHLASALRSIGTESALGARLICEVLSRYVSNLGLTGSSVNWLAV
jgi:hypothetical protein